MNESKLQEFMGRLVGDMGGKGLRTERRSLSPEPSREADVFIADTIGELGTFYALAPAALIGGSLIERGGQNPIDFASLFGDRRFPS